MNCSEKPETVDAALHMTIPHPEPPVFGAIPIDAGVRFVVPSPGELTLVIHDGPAAGDYRAGSPADGLFECVVERAAAGHRYSYRIGDALRPDPASRFQPDGVHGPSQVIDPAAFAWSDAGWPGVPARDLVVYELHVGTASPDGTFAGAAAVLETLRDQGITMVELMPITDFPGTRNWGYDGVCLYAPSRVYGSPDDLRRLVDRAHRLGLGVMLDVVYNHLGPEGSYLAQFLQAYFTDRHHTPWGCALNLDGPGSALVRHFILDNARHWIREYHLDGLRLDATHALVEEDEGSIVREIARAARSASATRVFIHAEDHRNLAGMIEDAGDGGWGLDGVWADDFHHVVRRLLARDGHGYYADFQGTTEELARTIRQGWLYTGQVTPRKGIARGSDPSHIPMSRFVVCLQNHDQIGNRAMGERLHHEIAPDAWRAASTLLLTVPMTPLLFMGQEWAARTPFLYFTDLEPDLGRLVTEGRRREFAAFPEFADESRRDAIPDPQAPDTYHASRLRWEERGQPGHAGVAALYRRLLTLRTSHAALGASLETAGDAEAPDAGTVVMRRAADGETFWVVARLTGAGMVDLAPLAEARGEAGGDWTLVLSTEDPTFADDSTPPSIDRQGGAPLVRFERPGAVIFRRR